MKNIKITKRYHYHGKRGPSYVLTPEMGVVDHFPARICKAAVDAGCAEYIKQEKPSKKGAAKPAK